MRGAAALYVVLYHAYSQLCWRHDGGGLSRTARLLTAGLTAGGYGVVMFIVLSGYCLMLPVARSTDGHLRGGWKSYLFRRCRRILPPYYAALVFSLLLIWLIPGLSGHPTCFGDQATPVSIGSLIGHLLMVYNVRPEWMVSIDPPMWSVVVEFQIYFLLPSLFLPVYRRLGAVAVVIFAYVLVTLFALLTHGRYDYSQPNFIGLFCMGMLGAVVSQSGSAEAKQLAALPWSIISIVALVIAIAVPVLNPARAPAIAWAPHVFFGIAATGLLIICAFRLQTGGRLLRHLFESRWLVRLGAFSYSLYLIHMPLQAVLMLVLRRYVHSPDLQLVLILIPGVPMVCGIAACFYFLFERPLMRTSTVKEVKDPAL